MLDEERLIADENEKKYFGFSSTELVEDLRLPVSNSILAVLKDIQETLKTDKPDLDKAKSEACIQQTHELYMRKFDESLPNFEKEIRNMMSVPEEIFEEDDEDGEKYTEEDVKRIIEETEKLEQEYLREKCFLMKCKQRKEDFDNRIKPIYEKTQSLIPVYSELSKQESSGNAQKFLKLKSKHEEFLEYYLEKNVNVVLAEMSYKPKTSE